MINIELGVVVVSYGMLLACGVGLILYSVLDTFFPLSGSRRRRRW